ncbi:DUF6290 family protein [Desulfovibrio sp. JC010]|uniref:type II toxin-antitoxin system RelB family antitoxin n=1 Tax=Desulfovibrio sp. JC010 TaxID=2593641 RepID=UPI0013D70CEB|nr:DUF6290 family protein [Desulfovibrio sp. JC010]NDV27089.1 TraY domain-containing protein [Desulfovibrio sp. JC010]
MLSVRLPEEIEQKLTQLAEKTGRTKSYYAKKAIISFLEDKEDHLLAVQAYEEHLESGKKTFTSAEVRKDLGLEG